MKFSSNDSAKHPFLWVCIGMLSLLSASLFAAETPASNDSVGTQTVLLEYHEADYVCNGNWSMGVDHQSTPFKKEPAIGNAKVYRGRLILGQGTGRSLPFIWIPGEGKLYLDLNRNGDFTDDPQGVYSSDRKGGTIRNMQVFNNVRLECKVGQDLRRYCVELTLRQYGSSMSAFMGAKSFWQGKLVVNGQEWQFGAIEVLAELTGSIANLLCRPWKDRNVLFNAQTGSLDAFPLPPRLFFGNKAYSVSCKYGQQGDKSGYLLELKELQPKLGELKLTGKFLKRVLMTSSTGYTALLDTPDSVAKLPVGTYNHYRASLEAGGTKAHVNLNNRVERSVLISQDGSASLIVGGPLTNKVTVNRRGKHLALGYSLVGADFSEYQLETKGEPVPPQFAIYQGSQKIASGSFQFG